VAVLAGENAQMVAPAHAPREIILAGWVLDSLRRTPPPEDGTRDRKQRYNSQYYVVHRLCTLGLGPMLTHQYSSFFSYGSMTVAAKKQTPWR
jgi:hypothetical protein